MYLYSAATESKWVFCGKVAVSAAVLASYGWFIVTGAPGPAAHDMHESSAWLRSSGPHTMRLDTALPGCEGTEVTNGVLGLLRSENIHVVGLSDLVETGHKDNGNRTCEAVVNRAFGTQPISYTVERIGQRRKTWELSVTLH